MVLNRARGRHILLCTTKILIVLFYSVVLQPMKVAQVRLYHAHFLMYSLTHLLTYLSGEVIHLNDLWLMRMSDSNCDQWTWSCVNLNGLAPSPRDLPGMVCVNDKLLILGGYGLCEDVGVDDDDEDNDEMDEDEDNNIEDAVDTQPSGDSGSNAPSIELPSSDLGGEVAALVQQIDGINISTNEVPEDSMDEEVDDVVVDYLDDCFVIDLNDGVCNEVSLEEVVVSATSDAPSIWPGRRGCKYVHIANTSNHIMSFGGYDGENFYGLTEVIDCTRI